MRTYVYECSLTFLTIDRAKKLVPPEYISAWNWFEQNRGTTTSHLPMGDYAPAGLPITLARQAGIHSPDYRFLPSGGAGKSKYVLSIHSEGQRRYDDKDVIQRSDGTWIFDYCAHKLQTGTNEPHHFNENMMRNMNDGVPVAVMVRNKKGVYDILGLAFIEQYNKESDIFTLHGPVTPETESAYCFSKIGAHDLTPREKKLLSSWKLEDERKMALIQQVQREQQSKFRAELLSAYDGTCALTGVDVTEVLQAAHIDRYRGPKSQIVQNGILLRSDIHLLYDANLMSVSPVDHRVVISEKIANSPYRKYKNAMIEMPSDPLLRPDDNLLGMHYAQFCYAEKAAS